VIIAGIDEAGLGPVLGPLVVSATAFRLPDELAGVPMWQSLAGAVARKPSKKPTRVAFADSKKLYNSQKSRGIEHLERGVLTMLSTMDQAPASIRALLAGVAPASLKEMARYAWYSHNDLPLPRLVSATGVSLCGNSLARLMDQTGISRPLCMRAEVVFEGEYNRLVTATDNKSITLLNITSRLLAHLWNISAGQDMKIYVDRQGGRMHYLQPLQMLFEGCQFKILDETERNSAYRIHDGRRTVEVHFMVEGEDQHLPIALASMLSKYLRELLMELFNSYWGMHVPNIAPTAGYYTDGNRFWQQIQPHVQGMGFDTNMLYRSR